MDMGFETAYSMIEEKPRLEEVAGNTLIRVSNTAARHLKKTGKTYDSALREMIVTHESNLHNCLLAMATELKLLVEQQKELTAEIKSFLVYAQSKTGY